MFSRPWIPIEEYSMELGLEVSRSLEGSKLLITGGLGLLGLSALGYITYLRKNFGLTVDLTLTSKTRDGLALAEDFGSDFNFVQGDLSSALFLSSLPKFDYIIHAAGYGQPSKFLSDPLATLSINSYATIELRRLANQGFLFVSSSEVYSGVEHSLVSESEIGSTNPSHARAPYIEAKRFGEAATLVESGNGLVAGSVARLALAYGPGTRLSDQRVLSELVVRGLTEGRVELRDSGHRIRNYCYSEDAVEMLFGILTKGRGETFNVGGGSTTSIRELGRSLANRMGVEFSAPDKNLELDSSPLNVSLDCSKVLLLLGKETFVPLEIGLHQTIEWYRYLLPKEG